jgi:hypothetical protein
MLDRAGRLFLPSMLTIAVMTAKIATTKPNKNLARTDINSLPLNGGENFDEIGCWLSHVRP